MFDPFTLALGASAAFTGCVTGQKWLGRWRRLHGAAHDAQVSWKADLAAAGVRREPTLTLPGSSISTNTVPDHLTSGRVEPAIDARGQGRQSRAEASEDDDDPSGGLEEELAQRRLARWERNFLLELRAKTGRSLADWMTAMATCADHDSRVTAALNVTGIESSRQAVWLTAIFRNGGQPVWCAPDPRFMAPAPLPTPAAKQHKIAPVKAGQMLIDFMCREGATGYFTVKEIDAWWARYRAAENIDWLHPTVVRQELSAIRNVWCGLKRLNMPQYREVKARNAGLERCVLYRIPVDQSVAGWTPDQHQRSTGARSGKRPANPQKRVLPGSFDHLPPQQEAA